MSTPTKIRDETPDARSYAAEFPRRRSFLGRVLAMSTLSFIPGGWWLRSSEIVVIRDGWVLSRGD